MSISVSVIMGVCSSSILGVWVSMEVNMVMFLIFMLSNSTGVASSGMQYFIVQSVSSMVMLLSYLLAVGSSETGLLLVAMVLKVGAAPCHFWFFSIISELSWEVFIWLSTIQKLLPLYVMSMMNLSSAVGVVSALVSVLGGVSSGALKQLLGYSSLLTFSWVVGVMSSYSAVVVFVLIYLVGLTTLCSSMSMYSGNSVLSLFSGPSEVIKVAPLLGVWSMAGLPPTVGFYMKALMTQLMLPHYLIYVLLLLLSSGMFLLAYVRMLVAFLLPSSSAPWGTQSSISSFTALGLLFPLWALLRSLKNFDFF